MAWTGSAWVQSRRAARDASIPEMMSVPCGATSRSRGITMADRTVHLRTCPLCEAMCGLEIHVEDDRVALIRPDRDDVWSKGYICPKGTTLGHLYDDPDRVRVPMVREGDDWREVSWDDAFARCEELLHGVLERHGR